MKKKDLKKVTVVGAGQIGPDIALHFAKTLSSQDTKVIVIDISEEALKKAQEKAYKKIQKGVEVGAFKPEQGEKIKQSLMFTNNYQEAANSQLIVEAATEDENIKDKIFKQLEVIADNECVFMSNSSHMQPEVIFRNIKNKTRCLVAHYFFPAEINPVVEIVPGSETNKALTEELLSFYEAIGKVPIKVKSSYGYAIDPIFEGLCQTAIMCLEEGIGNEKEIDAAAVKALGLGVGPFTALNLTGGNPITAHGLDEMGKLVMPWFKTPKSLAEKAKNKELWNTAQRGEKVVVDKEKEEKLVRIFKGSYFALASFIMDLGIVDGNDLNMACELSLVIKQPLRYMNETGLGESYQLVKEFCNKHKDFPMPKSIVKARDNGEWNVKDIVTEKRSDIFIITIRRPKVLNALNLDVLQQIKSALETVRDDKEIKAAVITGFGVKAFVSGADINMLSSLRTPAEGFENSQTFQSILNYIENYSKPVVCAMNGFAFGGGNELAMACTARISKKGIKVLVCQPEVNLGFIPGAGGTQRLPRLVGVAKAAEILRTGKSVSSKEALEIGLVMEEVEGDLMEEAISLARNIAVGRAKVNSIPKTPLNDKSSPVHLELNHLSKKIDELMIKAIYEGSRLPLDAGLKLESEMFAECLKTEDMRIGLTNFNTNGPKAKAEFMHK